MKITKNTPFWLLVIPPALIALILTSCAPAVTVVSPTAMPQPTLSPVSRAAALTPTPIPAIAIPTSMPAVSLSPEGPWLVYRHNALSLAFADRAGIPEEFVILNQDGVGRISITLPDCKDRVNAFLMNGENSANYMAEVEGDIYIFRPSQAAGLLVYRPASECSTFFNEKSGLLASFYQAANDTSPELILYDLPGGKIRGRFPLVRCAKDAKVCDEFRSNWGQMMLQHPQWSPNGRYLAFAAIQDAASSDLFVYDVQDGNLRRLTNGPDWVGPIEWSPDGTQIIMQELLGDGESFFTPFSKPPSSVWSVSVSTNEIELLYSTGDAYTVQSILFWLDDKRYFAAEGVLGNAEAARNLRLVDMGAGTNRIVFDGDFVMESYDPVHETFALYLLASEKYSQGIYLVSAKNGSIRPLNGPPYNPSVPDWDSGTGLFVSEDLCEKDPNSLQAFDHQGNFTCVPKPAPVETASYPAPNGIWSVSVKDGLWLETKGQAAVPVSQETALHVIWCPDSSCFFFSVLQPNDQATLYRVSLPDLTVTKVDEGIARWTLYQWLGLEK